MATIPGFLLRHTVVIEPYQGAGPAGPVYGDPVTVRCFVDEQTRMVRSDTTGTEVVSSTTVRALLGTIAPPESRVTVNGHVATVIAASRFDGGGLATPDHLELALT